MVVARTVPFARYAVCGVVTKSATAVTAQKPLSSPALLPITACPGSSRSRPGERSQRGHREHRNQCSSIPDTYVGRILSFYSTFLPHSHSKHSRSRSPSLTFHHQQPTQKRRPNICWVQPPLATTPISPCLPLRPLIRPRRLRRRARVPACCPRGHQHSPPTRVPLKTASTQRL